MQVLAEEQEEPGGEVKRFVPRPCLQRDDPPCIKVCPVYATYRNPEGIVATVYPRCIGCRFCMAACPYNAKYFNWYRYQEQAPGQNPDVSAAPQGRRGRSVPSATIVFRRRGSGPWLSGEISAPRGDISRPALRPAPRAPSSSEISPTPAAKSLGWPEARGPSGFWRRWEPSRR